LKVVFGFRSPLHLYKGNQGLLTGPATTAYTPWQLAPSNGLTTQKAIAL